jgi:hypothetical protein
MFVEMSGPAPQKQKEFASKGKGKKEGNADRKEK